MPDAGLWVHLQLVPLAVDHGAAVPGGQRTRRGQSVNQAIYDELLRVARSGTGATTTYSEIAPLAGLDMSTKVGRIQIAHMLGEISTAEHEAGRPMLSALVILKGTRIPGSGFFDLAQNLGLYDGGDKHAFWRREAERVRAYWREH